MSTPDRPAVRQFLRERLISDADFEAFCRDYFPQVKWRFSDGMDRVRKENILLDHGSVQRVYEKLCGMAPEGADGGQAASSVGLGIITALPKEFAAMKAMLDDWEDDRSAPGEARYLKGRIHARSGGSHALALTLLPNMGNHSAAARAADLLKKHPRVRAIIMVGIAGGAPHPNQAEHHVRLGDVVVSTEGVVQYDYVKETLAEVMIRSPPRPPSAELVEAVRLLEAQRIAGVEPWLKHLTRAQDLEASARPSGESDVLAATPPRDGIVPHPEDALRVADQPRIFLGRIGSADTLLKNPVKRDLIRDKFDVRALEMEGSGIADATWQSATGYLVVRGICDYCDENKNNLWQGYAAVAAAAYVRALLESMPA